MDETRDAKDDIDNGKLLFICSNKERFNFSTFNKPSNFISAIYNGKISLKEAEISQRKLHKRTEELSGYRPENAKEKAKINGVLMQANDLLKYRDKIIDAFKDDTFQSEHLKNDAAHDFVVEDVNNFIQKIESMAGKINLSLFDDFVESSSLVDYAKTFINTKNPDKNKESVVEIKDRLSDLKDKIKK